MPEAAPSRLIAFFDECGDHSLEKIDRDFPLFVLSTVIVERRVYQEQIIPALGRLKMRFWNHEGVNLHSRDVRKALGDFAFMQLPGKRAMVLSALSEMMKDLPITLFITAIHKQEHRERYGMAASNPYDLALTYTFERVLHFLDGENETHLPVTAEARGKNEDNELEAAFYRMMTQGTRFIPATRFQRLNCPISFRRKTDNIAGLQIADLCAHPAARRVLNPAQPNQAWDLVCDRVYKRGGITGWKIFP
ncbi:MAG: DUF3800 domain-containing protein [Verrucomicrobia bacterium]|nr:DUF3800 domain-containing protein [Verrucomicrobiota bacterium]